MVVDIIESLVDVLADEKAALLDGDFESVGDFTARKSDLCDTLEKISADQGEWDAPRGLIDRLQVALSENEKIIAGAQAGLTQAQARIAEIYSKGSEVGVYDAAGGRPQLEQASGSRGKFA
ncbi:MAG: hypothetical protein EVA70_02960 [Parvularculaceae bacterium]|nr:MAG: hypothetical protein EVA70_02960 [Parvularculaceae bacterium]